MGDERPHLLFNLLAVARRGHPHVNARHGKLRDNIHACAALDNIHVNGQPPLGARQLFDARNLPGQFGNRIDACRGIDSRVSRPAANGDLKLPHSFAGGFEGPLGRGRLQHQHRAGAAGLRQQLVAKRDA